MKVAWAAFIPLVLAACQPEDKLGGDPAPASFVCAEGKNFAVNYAPQGDSVTLTFENGETAQLLAEPSDTGARFGWPSDGTNYVYVASGQDATVFLKDGSRGGVETPIYQDCKLQ